MSFPPHLRHVSDWDLFVAVIETTDRVSHMMWRLIDPQHPMHDAEQAARHGDAIERIYRRADDLVGRLLATLPPGTAFFVVSDHFNLRRRESRGIVSAGADYRALQDEIAGKLVTLTDPEDGARIFREIYRRDDIYKGEYQRFAPDLQSTPAPDAPASRRLAPAAWATLALDLALSAAPTAETIGALREGEVLPILGESGPYLRVEDSSGARGWASVEDVRRLDRAPNPPPSPSPSGT